MLKARKFLLEFPYSQDWTYGSVVINPEGRRNILLTTPKEGNTKKASTVSYARYLFAVHLGRYLEKFEQVDHINGNKLDDFIDNLQIITKQENLLKSAIETNKTRLMAELHCLTCGVTFIKPYNQTHYVKGGLTTSCSRRCSGKAQNTSKESLKELGDKQLIRKFRVEHAFNKLINTGATGEEYCTNCAVPVSSCLCERLIAANKHRKIDHMCKICDTPLKYPGKTGLCGICANNASKPHLRKVERPSKVELLKLINKGVSWLELGRMFGVSDTSVKKWAKSYGINYEKENIRAALEAFA